MMPLHNFLFFIAAMFVALADFALRVANADWLFSALSFGLMIGFALMSMEMYGQIFDEEGSEHGDS